MCEIQGKLLPPTYRKIILLKGFGYKGVWAPKGFVSDGASIPRGLWNILPPFGEYAAAAVMHDYMYRANGTWSRKEADRAFKELMKACDVPKWKRFVMHRAVRAWGWIAWKRNPVVIKDA